MKRDILRPGGAFVLAVSVLVGVLAGSCACSVDHVVLSSEWAPLERVQNDPRTKRGVFRTRVPFVYTGDACDFLAHSQDERDALLLHEQLHARHQLAQGLADFEKQYASSRTFRWDEERAGWKLQLEHCVRKQVAVDVVGVARFLAEEYNSMVEYDSALAWVAATVTAAQGR